MEAAIVAALGLAAIWAARDVALRMIAARDVERRALAAEARAARMLEEIAALGARIASLEECSPIGTVQLAEALAPLAAEIATLKANERMRDGMARSRA